MTPKEREKRLVDRLVDLIEHLHPNSRASNIHLNNEGKLCYTLTPKEVRVRQRWHAPGNGVGHWAR